MPLLSDSKLETGFADLMTNAGVLHHFFIPHNSKLKKCLSPYGKRHSYII